MMSARRVISIFAVSAAASLSLAAGARPAAVSDAGVLYASGRGAAAEIWVLEENGLARRVTRNKFYEGFPAWSPDRTQIAFVRAVRGDADIYVMSSDGTGVRRLTRTRGQDLYPAWSPDGKQIAFSSNRGGVEPELYVMRADGSSVRRLTRTAKWVEDTQPRFSPDGRYIVFTSNRVAFANYEIFRIRASDGGGARRLTFYGSSDLHRPGDDLMASYSPDGSRIVFVSERGGGYGVWSMNAAGRDLRRVVRNRGLNHAFPRYSPDGTRIAYVTFSPDGNVEKALVRSVGADGRGQTVLTGGREVDW
jgi:Tol biopolymer transport system component